MARARFQQPGPRRFSSHLQGYLTPMSFQLPAIGIGWIIALLVLVVVIVLFFVDDYSREALLALIGALALARLLP